MKKIFFIPTAVFVLTTILIVGCKKIPDGWSKEKLNDDLKIAFPNTYTGEGLHPTEEGSAFSKRRNDERVVFEISGATYFHNYGATIQNPLPDTYGRFDKFIDIYNKEKLQGRFYYLENNGATFRQSEGIYLVKRKKKGDDFSEVIGLSYSQTEYSEVIKILETIR